MEYNWDFRMIFVGYEAWWLKGLLITLAYAARQMVVDTRRFARRQRTWFRGLTRRGIDVTWIGPDDVDRVLAAW